MQLPEEDSSLAIKNNETYTPRRSNLKYASLNMRSTDCFYCRCGIRICRRIFMNQMDIFFSVIENVPQLYF